MAHEIKLGHLENLTRIKSLRLGVSQIEIMGQ